MFQISQNIAHPGRTENGTPGPMSVLPRQFNQRSYRRVVEYVRGVKKRARTASPSRSVAQAEHGERPDKIVQALAHRADRANIPQGIQCTETSLTMLEPSSSHVPQSDPRKELLQRCVHHGPRTSHGHTHASVSLLYYPHTPQLRSTRYVLPHTDMTCRFRGPLEPESLLNTSY